MMILHWRTKTGRGAFCGSNGSSTTVPHLVAGCAECVVRAVVDTTADTLTRRVASAARAASRVSTCPEANRALRTFADELDGGPDR